MVRRLEMIRLEDIAEKVIETDILIVGSGGAGATAAIEAIKTKLRVTIATKGRIGKCGATVTGDADLDVDSKSLHERFSQIKGSDPRDSPVTFFKDIVKGGKFLNNQKLVEIHVREAPNRLQDIIDWGAKIEKTTHASGHSYPRGVYIPGMKLMPVLKRQANKVGVNIVEDTIITDIIVQNDQVAGAVGVNIRSGGFLVFKAKAVVLATGGCMRIYPFVTAPDELTGDGMAMAYRAGAELVDMEFPMFLPGCFVHPPALSGVDVPFILSTEGFIHGHLLNRRGERFMRKWAPKTLEHTTRDICSVAMMSEILAGNGSPHGGVFVSLRHLPTNLIEYLHEWLPWLRDRGKPWTYGGFDLEDFIPRETLKMDALEAAPAGHFTNGGIKINERCETNIKGLFAAGETTAGVHGGNRLSGNAFTEMIVWGSRSGKFAATYASTAKQLEIDTTLVERLRNRIYAPLERKEGENPIKLRKQMQQLAWEKIGVVRDRPRLENALKEIERMRSEEPPRVATKAKNQEYNREWIGAIELENMLLIMKMIARSALMRTESRAAHYRKDYPMTDYDNWTKNIIVQHVDGKPQLTTQSVVITKLQPPKGKLPYGVVE